MNVLIPEPLRSYTQGLRQVEADGTTLCEVLDALDGRYPGIRFRMIDEQEAIRPHVRIFVNGAQVRALDFALGKSDEIFIVQALSGG